MKKVETPLARMAATLAYCSVASTSLGLLALGLLVLTCLGEPVGLDAALLMQGRGTSFKKLLLGVLFLPRNGGARCSLFWRQQAKAQCYICKDRRDE